MSNLPAEQKAIQDLCGHWDCKTKGTYTLRATCRNCGWSGSLELTRGHTFDSFRECPKCGCRNTLLRATA